MHTPDTDFRVITAHDISGFRRNLDDSSPAGSELSVRYSSIERVFERRGLAAKEGIEGSGTDQGGWCDWGKYQCLVETSSSQHGRGPLANYALWQEFVGEELWWGPYSNAADIVSVESTGSSMYPLRRAGDGSSSSTDCNERKLVDSLVYTRSIYRFLILLKISGGIPLVEAYVTYRTNSKAEDIRVRNLEAAY